MSDIVSAGAAPFDVNRAALTEAWRQHRTRLLALCARMVGGHRQDAEDVLGRAALRALEDCESRTSLIASYPAWLTRLIFNVSVDLHRERASRAQTLEHYLDTMRTEVHEDDPESAGLRVEAEERLSRAIDELPPGLATPCRRRFIDEAPYEAIASEMGLTNETVRKRVQKARGLLRELVGLEGAGER